MPETVKFTEEEIKAIAIYLDLSLIPYIANKDNEVDNLNWVRLMTGIWYKCTEAMKKEKD